MFLDNVLNDAEIPELQKKAENLLNRVRNGEDFGELAKRFSDDKETAKQNGFLGEYQRGALAKELEEAVFKLKKNQTTDVIQTKQGFLILQVLEHYDEGEQPLAKVEPEMGLQEAVTPGQLSEAAGADHVTLALVHWPASVLATMLAEQAMVGFCASLITTGKEQAAVFPAASVTTQETGFVPIANAVPEAGVAMTEPTPGQLSEAET